MDIVILVCFYEDLKFGVACLLFIDFFPYAYILTTLHVVFIVIDFQNFSNFSITLLNR